MSDAQVSPNTKISEAGLPTRTANVLMCWLGEDATVFDLTKHTQRELLRLPNFGRRSVNEVIELLSNIGRRLRDERQDDLFVQLQTCAELAAEAKLKYEKAVSEISRISNLIKHLGIQDDANTPTQP